jgi:drug/metabolite transporter (DMT)-like permease
LERPGHPYAFPPLLISAGKPYFSLFFPAADSFIAGWKLSMIGALQTAFYALIVLTAGVLLYHESLTRLQVLGVLLAFGGVVLINWRS